MSGVARTISQVAGVVATVAAFIPGGQLVAAIAGAVSAVAGAVAVITAKPPPMRGTVNEVMIGSNMPVPYAMGRSYVGGNRIYEDSANTNNYDRTQIFVYSHAGPIDSFEALQADFTTIAFDGTSGGRIKGAAIGYYGNGATGYLWADSKLGERPDTALAAYAGRAAFRDWGSSHKLSGLAAASVTMEFDEDGKRWSSGIPQWGMVGKWVLVYDPRLDDTYPGGGGDHRWDDESTWEWSENPGLHALAYARGRYMNDVKVVGVGLSAEAIDVAKFVELANLCEANAWTVGGVVYEGPGLSKWDNLKRILIAGAAQPVWVGGLLTCKISAPRTALDTITNDDLADGSVEITAMKSWRERHNSIVPRYRSEAHKWDYVQAEAVTSATYVTEDGETKTDEVQFDLVQDVDQAAQLAAYELVNRREFGPILLNCKPRLMLYRPGDALEIDLPECGLDGQLAIVTARTVDPSTGTVQLMLESETDAKHAYALGQTGTAPPTPTIYSPEDLDANIGAVEVPIEVSQLIGISWVEGMTFSISTAGDVDISDHDRVYADKQVAVGGQVVDAPVGATAGDIVAVYYDQATRVGGVPDVDFVYGAVRLAGGVGELPGWGPSFPYRHAVAIGYVPGAGTTDGGSAVGSGGGAGGSGGGWRGESPIAIP